MARPEFEVPEFVSESDSDQDTGEDDGKPSGGYIGYGR